MKTSYVDPLNTYNPLNPLNVATKVARAVNRLKEEKIVFVIITKM